MALWSHSGTFGIAPRKMAHFAWSKTETILQIHGIGPLSSTVVERASELTEEGVFSLTSLLLPESPTSFNPPDCFAVKVNAKVRGEPGESIVVGARSLPSSWITQYWVQKANGERFWATFQELKTTVTAPASTHIGLRTLTFSSAEAEPHAGLVLGSREVRSDLRGRGWITA